MPLSFLAFCCALTVFAPRPQAPELPPIDPVPSPAQMGWQSLELLASLRPRSGPAPTEAALAALAAAGFDGLILSPGRGDEGLARAAAASEACAGSGLALALALEFRSDDPDAGLAEVEELLAATGPLAAIVLEAEPGYTLSHAPAAWVERVREARPDAVLVGPFGPDGRSVPGGRVGEVHWCSLRADNYPRDDVLATMLRGGDEEGPLWAPALCRVALGASTTTATLDEVYARTVGRGASLRVDLPLDETGALPAGIARVLTRWRLSRELGEDLAPAASVTASSVLGGASGAGTWGGARALDGDLATAWAPERPRGGMLLFAFPEPVVLDTVVLCEALRHGQRVRDFALDVQTPQGGWLTVVRAATVGARRHARFAPVRTARLRLRIIDARATPALAQVSLHRSPPRASLSPTPRPFLGSMKVQLGADAPWVEVRYTLDGSDPGADAPLASEEPLLLSRTTTVTARAFEGGVPGPPLRATFTAVPPGSLLPATQFFREPDAGLRYAVVRERGLPGDAEVLRRGSAPDPWREVREAKERGAVRFEGHFRAPADGVYGFRLDAPGPARFSVEGRELATDTRRELAFVPLAAGWHPLRLDLSARAVGETVVYVVGPELDDVPLPVELLYQ